MESGAPKKPVVVSDRFWESYNSVYEQGLDLFGYFQAETYAAKCRFKHKSNQTDT